jgi:membrane-associated phospholipid phosphatase
VVFVFVYDIIGIVNHLIFKTYVSDPRPLDFTPFLFSEQFRIRVNGMPSGHAQQTAFALTFSYLLSGHHFYLSWGLFLMTVIQRYVFKNHTFLQLLVGSLLGFNIAYVTYYLVTKLRPNEVDE